MEAWWVLAQVCIQQNNDVPAPQQEYVLNTVHEPRALLTLTTDT